MDNLISSTKKAINYHSYVKLPFSIYSAYQEQRIKNVPIAKPGEFKHEVRQFQKPYDNQQAEQISLMV